MKWPRLCARYSTLPRYHKFASVCHWVSPDVPVAVVDSYVVLRNISEAYTRGMRAAIDEFLQRPGPTLIIAPSRYIGLTRSIVDLLCRFARDPHDPMFDQREIRQPHTDPRLGWPDHLPPGLEEPVLLPDTGD